MPAVSERQRRAAGAELARRLAGLAPDKKRVFGTALVEDLRDFARKPKGKKRGKKS